MWRFFSIKLPLHLFSSLLFFSLLYQRGEERWRFRTWKAKQSRSVQSSALQCSARQREERREGMNVKKSDLFLFSFSLLGYNWSRLGDFYGDYTPQRRTEEQRMPSLRVLTIRIGGLSVSVFELDLPGAFLLDISLTALLIEDRCYLWKLLYAAMTKCSLFSGLLLLLFLWRIICLDDSDVTTLWYDNVLSVSQWIEFFSFSIGILCI